MTVPVLLEPIVNTINASRPDIPFWLAKASDQLVKAGGKVSPSTAVKVANRAYDLWQKSLPENLRNSTRGPVYNQFVKESQRRAMLAPLARFVAEKPAVALAVGLAVGVFLFPSLTRPLRRHFSNE